LGFHCRSWVVWYYTFGVNCTKKFSRSHTHLFHFVKDPKSFTFNLQDIRVPSARQLVYADARADARGEEFSLGHVLHMFRPAGLYITESISIGKFTMV
jgi:hypothetical protein